MGRNGQRACATCTSFVKIIAKQQYLSTLGLSTMQPKCKVQLHSYVVVHIICRNIETRRVRTYTSYIPPAFSRTVPDLLNKEIVLSDSSGQQQKVKVSEVNGSFAFEEGWNDFSLDHELKVGYLLVFNYIKDLHFDVKIYDTSACEKLDFPKQKNHKKRSIGRSGSPVRDDILVRQAPNALVVSNLHVPKMKSQHSKVDLVGTQNSKESGQVMGIPEHCEGPCYPTSLEFDQRHGVDGTMRVANGDLRVSNVDNGTHICQNDAILCSNDTMQVGRTSFEISERNISLHKANKSTHDKTSTLKLDTNKKMKAIMPIREVQECQIAKALESDQAAISKMEHALHIAGFHNTKQKFLVTGEPKKLSVDMTPKLCGSVDKLNVTGEVAEKLKAELIPLNELEATGLPKETTGELCHDSDMFNKDNESPFKTAATLSCVVPNDNACLDLSASLPLTRKLKVSKKKAVVLLRDPQQRLWPVLYHEEPHLKVLAHGWLDFRRANNIQPEDECIFEADPGQPENKSTRILDVRIVHK